MFVLWPCWYSFFSFEYNSLKDDSRSPYDFSTASTLDVYRITFIVDLSWYVFLWRVYFETPWISDISTPIVKRLSLHLLGRSSLYIGVFLCNVSTLNMLIIRCWKCSHRPTQDVWVHPPSTVIWSEVRTWISRVVFLCLCAYSPSGQSDSGAVCVGDGVASEHRPRQKLHLALLGERPAAGNVSHRRLGVRTTVSFNAPHPTPSCSFCCLDMSATWAWVSALDSWASRLNGVEWT